MRTLKVFKTENEIMELSIANALFFILQENGVECKLINKPSLYIIEIFDEVKYSDLLLPEIEAENIDNTNSSMNFSELKVMTGKLEKYLSNEEYMAQIFNYFETLDESILSKELRKKEGALFIGTYTYTKGVRGYGKLGGSSLAIPVYIKLLCFLGFIKSTNYFKIKDVVEINGILIPEKTDVLLRPEYITYVDKETGEVKHLRFISKKDPKTLSLARLYLLGLKKLTEYTIAKNYRAIWLMQVSPTGNKPLNDKMLKLPVHDLSIDFIKDLLMKIEYSNVDRDAKLALSDYLLTQNFENYSKMIKTFSKTGVIMQRKYLEELIELQIDKVKEIYKDETAKKLGRGLNRLIRDKKGYSIQIGLLNCTEVKSLINIIKDLTTLYFRNYKSYVINDNDLAELINKVDDIKSVKIIADTIITYATIYVMPKDKSIE